MRPEGASAEAFSYHGGNLGAAARAFPQAPTPWIDLSTGINAVPYPVGALPPEAFARLPEAAAIASLEAVAASAYAAPAGAAVVAAPGTQALIAALPRLVAARRVGILGFTYAEHGRVWQEAGAAVTTVETVEALAESDVAVVVNPNNPDGRRVKPARLAALATDLGARGGLLVLDEAFVDVLPRGASLVPELPVRGAIVLRSFGKSYGLAGLRLGFAVVSADLAPVLRRAFGPWAVSGPAVAIGCRALGDPAWLAAAVTRLTQDALRLDGLITDAGMQVIGGTPLFRLAVSAEAGAMFRRLAASGILVRPFAERPHWLRFGIPAEAAQWKRLAAALKTELWRG